jgi:O-antigen/teichoic acid export membrane protein
MWQSDIYLRRTLMAENRRNLLTIGALLISVVIALVLVPVTGWGLTFPLVLLIFGLWMVALSAIRGSNPQKYERDAFSTLSLGLLLVVIGGAWSMLAYGISWIYSLALILVVLAALAIAAALRHK